MENKNKVKSHMHSSDARRIVNSLIIGIFEEQAPLRLMTVDSYKYLANKSGSCLTFKLNELTSSKVLNKVDEAT